MPKLTVNDTTVQVEAGKRLVLAVEQAGVRIGHRCGGNARCTTCRVQFIEGEPGVMTRAEHGKLLEKGLLGQVRLSCQIRCTHDMAVHPLKTLESEGWSDTGPAPDPQVQPAAEFFPKDAFSALKE
jgi:ferredoxin